MKYWIWSIFGIISVILFNHTIDAQVNDLQRGEELYIQQCSKCHRKNGSGVKLVYPPVRNADYIQKGDKIELLRGMLFGREGKITVNGYTYQGVMITEVDNSLSDAEIASILNYVMKKLNNMELTATLDDVKKAKKMGKLPVHK
jgi:mono/diheme cytochrome c family protein